ncbi:AAA family ATPase [Neisseria shayeganii]|uniref:AAA family ATPase n=1 Tax=Neisseria shayeganii TaxID=607712 RepID=A0A7D7NCJ0_9NEIS|nr:AAA family ATPase [Neisseria shayeganii]QMT41116.1 AAA family ATPase [Neisseria shayeganii]
MELNVRIKNFGKIRNADVAIRPFTVLTGCNSSGKSFVTRGLYSILYTLNQDLVFRHINSKLVAIRSWMDDLMGAIPRLSQSDISVIEDFERTAAYLQGQMAQQFDFLSLLKSRDLLLTFDPSAEQLEQHLQALKIQLKAGKGTKYRAVADSFLDLEHDLKEFRRSLRDWPGVYEDTLSNEIRKAFCGNFQTNNAKHLVSDYSFDHFVLDGETSVKVLPDGEVDFHIRPEVLDSAYRLRNVVYLESPVYFKMRQSLQELRVYSFSLARRGAVNPVPKYFYDLDNLLTAVLPDAPEKFTRIAEKIEDIINGRLVLTPQGEIVYQEDGRNPVSLNMASSGIANLGILALLLRRNVLDEGSFLFIDEPEINLHTTWQHVMVQILLDLSEAGVNVVIATHSLDMMHRLEHIVSEMEPEEAQSKVSVNRLSSEGETLPTTGSVLTDIYEAKQVLGAPYIDLMRERLP